MSSLPPGQNGDLLIHDGAAWVPYGSGAEGEALQVVGGVPAWGAGGGGASAIGFPMRSGAYYDNSFSIPFSSISTSAWAANRIDAIPLLAPHDVSIDRIAIDITTAAAAGGKARLGIYSDTGSGRPDGLLVDAGEVLVDTTGVKEIVLATPVSISAGNVCWLAVTFSIAPSLRMYTQSFLFTLFGESGVATQSRVVNYLRNVAYGPLPNLFGTPDETRNIAPIIAVRIA